MSRKYSTFAVTGSGETTALEDSFVGQAAAFGMTEREARAWELCVDDGWDPDKALALVKHARQKGTDPMADAQHIVNLRKALRGE